MTINELAPWKRDHCPSETDVASLESKHNIHFPVEYREFLKSHNGGHFGGELCFLFEGRRYSLDTLFGINVDVEASELCGGSLYLVDENVIDDNSPILYVPIGRTTKNYLLLLSIAQDEYFGCVILKTFDEAFDVFESFDDLISALERRV